MNRRSILYKGVWLDPNSQGYKLYQEKKLKELDQLMADCDRRAKELEGKYASRPQQG